MWEGLQRSAKPLALFWGKSRLVSEVAHAIARRLTGALIALAAATYSVVVHRQCGHPPATAPIAAEHDQGIYRVPLAHLKCRAVSRPSFGLLLLVQAVVQVSVNSKPAKTPALVLGRILNQTARNSVVLNGAYSCLRH